MDTKELLNKIDRDDGLTTVTMGELRKLHGSHRLGRLVNDDISRELNASGIGHLPSELPMRKENEVRLYRIGGKIDRVATAIFYPTNSGDLELRSIQDGLSAREILQELRDLIS